MSEPTAPMRTAKSTNAELDSSVDRLLMHRISNGDEAALTELVGRYGDGLARTIGRLTAWNRDGDDILQEVLITVWQKAHQYDGQGSLEGWLKRIAVNRCRNHFRMANAIQRKLATFAEWLGGRRRGTTKPQSEQTNSDDEIQTALGCLSKEDRTILVLFYLDEMTGEQVAHALRIKPSAVHVRLHRARKRLRKVLNDETSK